MSFDTEWSVDYYFDETEPNQHWMLRKEFMETHKFKYPEDRLVCLAKTFANIEFMGCRYNNELMTLIGNLAQQVPAVMRYRDQKKGKLQRTFVKASDAVKRNLPIEQIIDKTNARGPDPKRLKADRVQPTRLDGIAPEDERLLEKVRAQRGFRSKLIIFHRTAAKETPYQILRSSVEKLQMNLSVTRSAENKFVMKIQDEQVAEGVFAGEKAAKESLGAEVLAKLKECCFTVEIADPRNGRTIEKSDNPIVQKPYMAMPSNSIGARMMKQMGWAGHGQGLGKMGTGIQEPIESSETVDRLGFGHMGNSKELKAKVEQYFRDYLNKEVKHNLVFSTDFTKEERQMIHKIANKFKTLKVQSYGPKRARQLVVCHKINPWDIVENLLSNKEMYNYSLIRPTNM